jgi:hypothetical protein
MQQSEHPPRKMAAFDMPRDLIVERNATLHLGPGCKGVICPIELVCKVQEAGTEAMRIDAILEKVGRCSAPPCS